MQNEDDTSQQFPFSAMMIFISISHALPDSLASRNMQFGRTPVIIPVTVHHISDIPSTVVQHNDILTHYTQSAVS